MTKQGFKAKDSELDWEKKEEIEKKRKKNKGKQKDLKKFVGV